VLWVYRRRPTPHSALSAPVTGMLPLRNELYSLFAVYVSKCLISNNSTVNFVSRHDVVR